MPLAFAEVAMPAEAVMPRSHPAPWPEWGAEVSRLLKSVIWGSCDEVRGPVEVHLPHFCGTLIARRGSDFLEVRGGLALVLGHRPRRSEWQMWLQRASGQLPHLSQFGSL